MTAGYSALLFHQVFQVDLVVFLRGNIIFSGCLECGKFFGREQQLLLAGFKFYLD